MFDYIIQLRYHCNRKRLYTMEIARQFNLDLPNTDFAGYPANNFARYRIPGRYFTLILYFLKRFWKKFAHSKFASCVQQINRISSYPASRISDRIQDKRGRISSKTLIFTSLIDICLSYPCLWHIRRETRKNNWTVKWLNSVPVHTNRTPL